MNGSDLTEGQIISNEDFLLLQYGRGRITYDPTYSREFAMGTYTEMQTIFVKQSEYPGDKAITTSIPIGPVKTFFVRKTENQIAWKINPAIPYPMK